MSILSHIVLSKVVLSKFEPVKGEPFCWIDYSSSPQYLIRRGLAASFNTKENYYTPEVEEYLSRTVETHINQLLDQAPDISDEDITACVATYKAEAAQYASTCKEVGEKYYKCVINADTKVCEDDDHSCETEINAYSDCTK